MKRLIFASLCFTANPAFAQDMPKPWWQTSSAYEGFDGPALAPIASSSLDTPYADGTELSRLTISARPPHRDITITATNPVSDDEAATLLADYVTVSDDRSLTASGGVVVWYQGSRLVANRIHYDGQTGEMMITGPIHLTRPELADSAEDAILVADEAQLSQDMRNGMLHGARLILAREMQMAASEVTLSGNGRYTTLENVVTSSCKVCTEDPTPLWEVRAKKITHDNVENTLIFDHPQLRAYGLPILSWPGRVTAPDPTVDRLSGFLRPTVRTSSNLGFGVLVPYFKTLGPNADITLTPYLSASRTSTLMLRYRQAFWNGATEWNGAITRDDIRDGKTRGYLFGAAQWELPRGYKLGLQLQVTSDDGYLQDYDISDADRLWSGITLDRVSKNRLVWARIGNYHSLREDEDNSTSPSQVADVTWIRRWKAAGGEAELEWSAHAHRRPSDRDIIGRDVARNSVSFDWQRSQIIPGGILITGAAGLDTDLYAIRDDSSSDDTVVQATPWVSAELRFPMTGSDGRASYVLEPIAQLVWSPYDDSSNIPNEDSRQIEFDEGNLFALSRFPGWDAKESGMRANLGLTWTRFDPAGWSLSMAGGRVFHQQGYAGPNAPSLLGNTRSDWLIAGHYADDSGLSIANRMLFDDNFNVDREELRIGWARTDLQLSLGYIWMNADPQEERIDNQSELTSEIGWQLAEGWWADAYGRYDLEASKTQKAGFSVAYRNECVSIELSASRSFIDTVEVDPDTDIDLSVRLGGFGRAPKGKGTVARRSCLR